MPKIDRRDLRLIVNVARTWKRSAVLHAIVAHLREADQTWSDGLTAEQLIERLMADFTRQWIAKHGFVQYLRSWGIWLEQREKYERWPEPPVVRHRHSQRQSRKFIKPRSNRYLGPVGLQVER